jgi:hypothetical protein
MTNHPGVLNSRQVVKTFNDYTTKLYLFQDSLDKGVYSNMENASFYLRKTMDQHLEFSNFPHFFSIAAAWGYVPEGGSPVKALDIFSYKFDRDMIGATGEKWRNYNPEVSNFVVLNGNYDPTNRGMTCGVFSTVISQEERLRERTENLEDFLSKKANVWDYIRKPSKQK